MTMKCQQKYFGFKTSEEYINHCRKRESEAKSQHARDFWRMCAEQGSVY